MTLKSINNIVHHILIFVNKIKYRLIIFFLKIYHWMLNKNSANLLYKQYILTDKMTIIGKITLGAEQMPVKYNDMKIALYTEIELIKRNRAEYSATINRIKAKIEKYIEKLHGKDI